MLNFKNHKSLKILEEDYLEEKLVTFGNRAKYGQIVFLAGGAGSGKGFSIKSFIDSADFKIRDVDEMKQAWIKFSRMKSVYPEIANANLKDPKDVAKLHAFVKSKGTKSKTLDLLLSGKAQDRLPNIMFDITAKDITDITDTLPMLFAAGYEPSNIHVVWVLTNFHIAVENNAKRSRVVPSNILLDTHLGAKTTITTLAKRGLPRGVNGSFVVILNNPQNTVNWTDNSGKPVNVTDKNGKPVPVPKDFTRVILKRQGQKMTSDKAIKMQLLTWVIDNTPNKTVYK
jgi:dephospho-CoA kinase